MKSSFLTLGICLAIALPAWAGGRLSGTGGVTQVEGAAGGGLVPWALIAGTGTRDEIGVTAFATQANTQKFQLNSVGVAVGLYDRVELSYTRQSFDLDKLIAGQVLRQDIFGLKWNVFGNAVIDQDRLWPQMALGAQYKRNLKFDVIPAALGAKHESDVDLYGAATKVWVDGLFGRTSLLDITLRYTRANQLGLLGFGGDKKDSRCLCLETSAAVFLTDHWVAGAEYRQKPDNLSAAREDAFYDVFAAWVPNKNVSITAAYVNLGSVANQADQRGFYLSLQGAF